MPIDDDDHRIECELNDMEREEARDRRNMHRAAVNAGYASLAGYIEKWGEDAKLTDAAPRAVKADVNWELVAKTEEVRGDKAEAERDAALARAEKAEAALKASTHALRSYQFDNASPELAEEIADRNDELLASLTEGE